MARRRTTRIPPGRIPHTRGARLRKTLGPLSVGLLLQAAIVGLGVQGRANGPGTTIEVTSAADVVADDGTCALREAINAAKTGAPSGAAPGECPGTGGASPATILLTDTVYPAAAASADDPSFAYKILVPINLIGRGATVQGGPSFGVLRVAPGVTVTIDDLTLAGGNSSSAPGGALSNFGIVTATNVTFAGSSSAAGGGIANFPGAYLAVISGTVSSNSATGQGGGIVNGGVLRLRGTTVTGNQSPFGGGLANDTGGDLEVASTTITGNSATSNGGGLFNRGTSLVTDTILAGNGAGFGGGHFNGTAGVLEVANSAITDNSATQSGGGLFNQGTYTMTLATLAGSTARFGGGGFNTGEMTVDQTLIISNTASVNGGGLYNDGMLGLGRSTFTANQAANDGGGLYNDAGSLLRSTNVTFSGNSALGAGGARNNGAWAALYTTWLNNSAAFFPDLANFATLGSSSNIMPGCDVGVPFASNFDVFGDPNCEAFLGPAGGPSNVYLNGLGTVLSPVLRNNGGEVPTHALLAGSPAIGAGDPATAPAEDARGVERPQGSGADSGAVERLDPGAPPDAFIRPVTATLSVGGTQQFEAALRFPTGNEVDVTQAGTWTNASSAVGAISNGPGTQGLYRALGPGNDAVLYQASVDDIAFSVSAGVTVTLETGVAPDLGLTKAASVERVQPAGLITYTLVALNPGPQAAAGVVITDTIPADTTFNPGASDPEWLCTEPATGAVCRLELGTLPGTGGSRSTVLAVTVAPLVPPGTVITNTATIADDGSRGPDPRPDDNTATATTRVEAAPAPPEVCDNCVDDDGDGAIDLDDPDCCPGGQVQATVRGRIRPKAEGSKLALDASIRGLGFARRPTPLDVSLQLHGQAPRAEAPRPLNTAGPVYCARIPAEAFRARKKSLEFRDPKETVPGANGLTALMLQVKRNGSVRLTAGGKEASLPPLGPGPLEIDLGFGEGADTRCAAAGADLRAARRGTLRFR